jgi:phosphonate transport system substrate-binding protein
MKNRLYCLFIFVFVTITCNRKTDESRPHYSKVPDIAGIPVYTLAVHPLHNPNKLMQAYQPLINYLNSHIKTARFILEASRDYASYEEKYKNRQPEFLLPNPWQTLEAIKAGYHVLAAAGDPGDFKGIFIVRKDSKIKTPQDLKGKSVSYPSPTALAACIMPQYFLYHAGINISTDVENRYVGSQESSIMNVFLGITSAGATWPPPWRSFQKDHPREASELKVAWETESLINNSVMVRNDIPENLQNQVQKLLIELQTSKQGKEILAGMETARFIQASNKDYNVVQEYVKNFEIEVRKIKTK